MNCGCLCGWIRFEPLSYVYVPSHLLSLLFLFDSHCARPFPPHHSIAPCFRSRLARLSFRQHPCSIVTDCSALARTLHGTLRTASASVSASGGRSDKGAFSSSASLSDGRLWLCCQSLIHQYAASVELRSSCVRLLHVVDHCRHERLKP